MVAQSSTLPHRDLEQTLAERVREASAGQPHAEEIARAVTAFCETHVRERALPFSYLTMLLSRACAGAGDPRAAEQVVDTGLFPAAHATRVLAMVTDANLPPALLPLLASGLLRPARWETAGSAPSWTLDFRRLAVRHREAVELVYFQAVRALVETAAEVFRPHGGQGVLALHHVDVPVRSLLGCPAGPAARRRAVRDTLAVAEAALARTSRLYGWPAVPRLIAAGAAGG